MSPLLPFSSAPSHAETDPLSLHLDQTSPQTMTGLSDGYLKLTSGAIGTGTPTKTEVGLSNVPNIAFSGSNTGDETATRIAAINHGATVKSAIVDADEVTGQDSANSFSLIRTTWTSVKAFLKTYFDTIYQAAGSYITDAPSDGNTYGRKNAAWAVAGGGSAQAPVLSNYAQIGLNKSVSGTGETVLFTVPANKTVIISDALLNSFGCSSTCTYYFYSKVGGSTFRGWMNQTTTISTNTFTNNTAPCRILLNGGDQFCINTNVANLHVSLGYHQFDTTSGVKVIYQAIDNAQNYTLYTCPAGKSAILLPFAGVPYTASIVGAPISVYSTSSSSSGVLTIWYLTGSETPTNNNKINTLSVGQGNVTPAFNNINVAGFLAAGDSIVATSSVNNAGQNIFFTLYEV